MEGARSFSTSSKTLDFSALGTTDSCPAGAEDDKVCAKLQNFVHVGSGGIFPDLPPWRNRLCPAPRLLPARIFLMCGFHFFHPEVKDEGRIMLWKMLFFTGLSGVVLGTASHFRICFLLWRQERN